MLFLFDIVRINRIGKKFDLCLVEKCLVGICEEKVGLVLLWSY